jgi:hypothetical protein
VSNSAKNDSDTSILYIYIINMFLLGGWRQQIVSREGGGDPGDPQSQQPTLIHPLGVDRPS